MHPSPPRRTRRLLAAAVVAALLTTVACGSDESADDTAGTTGPTAGEGSTSTGGEGRACDQGATGDLGGAVPVEGSESDLTVTSFDGTEIRVHWFPTDGSEPAPTILMGPGWSLPGEVAEESSPLFGALGIGAMNDAGYNVLTWDPRGFGESTGTVTVNSPDTEGRDVQVLLDWVSEQPEAQTDAEGDPRVGMVGASYGGGIQLTVGGIDCRVDALVPTLAWHSLETGLYRDETVKDGWAQVLVDIGGAAGSLDPHITSAAASGHETGTLSAEDEEWFRARGPGDLVDEITAPTLLVQGTVDTLFTLDEAVTVFRSLQERDVPAGMLWFCGGHGVCLTHEPDDAWITAATFAWLDRWVKGDESVDTGPVVTVVDQDGDRWTGDDVAPDEGGEIGAGTTGGTLPLVAEGGSGPYGELDSSSVLASVVADIVPGPADNAVEVPITTSRDALVVGAPRMSFTYEGTAPDGPEPTRVFAQIVDEATGTVVGNQVTPIAVTLDGAEHTVEADLETIAHDLEAGATLTLQLVATTVSYATPRLGGEITFSAVEVTLPTTTALTPA